jgi:uncharacterized membrane protein YphA (DoxX/SURF4 family)
MSYLGPSVAIFLIFLILAAIGLAHFPRSSWLANGTLGNTLQAAFVLGPVFVWVIRAHRYNATQWRERLHRWERSFRCSRCGAVFLIPAHR